MAEINRLSRMLAVLLAAAVLSCSQVGPLTLPPESEADMRTWTTAPTPGAQVAKLLPEVNSVPRDSIDKPVAKPALPGDKVIWRNAPSVRAAPAGVGSFLADVESRLPAEMGTRYRAPSRVTWCHETTHGVQSALRNNNHLPAFYPGGGKFALVDPPAVTLAEVAQAVPPRLRGTRYQLYLVSQQRDWAHDPLYVWDEWVAYDNGTTTGIQEMGRSQSGASDDAVACIELSGYALAVASAARRKGIPVSEQFREFLAWELRRSLGLYARAITMPAFAWFDRRLEQAWRTDPFVGEELRALYGEALTVRDLLPAGKDLALQSGSPSIR